ncbi:enoyl-CoA hydratase/isomerase family protein [Roseobacteraceae bacterium S113]
MAIVDLRVEGSVAVLTLCNGENKQDLAFAEAMLAALDEAEADKAVRALVITSDDEKNWSQGVNLGWLMKEMHGGGQDNVRAFMRGMNAVFARLLTYPVPVIGALTGHAFGNGAMLACCCDFRVMRSDRGYMCFPEVDISIPFLPGMVAFCRNAIPEYRFNEMKLTGRRLTAQELLADHVVMAVYDDADATLAGAMEFAASFKKSRAIFGEHKRRMHGHILEVMERDDAPYIAALNLTV